MKVHLEQQNHHHFEGKGRSGVPVSIDSEGQGASPMELLLMGVGGCSAIDIVTILKKQRQQVKNYKMEVEGERKEVRQAKPFKAVCVKIYLEGEIEEAKALRAAQLSFEKYCSVSLTMQDCVAVSYELVLNGKKISIGESD